jgi:hypothetical protein
MKGWIRAVPAIVVGVVAVTFTATPPLGAVASTPTTARVAKHAPAKVAPPAPRRPAKTAGGAAGLLQVIPVGTGATSGRPPGIAVAIDPGASAVRSFDVVNRSRGLVLTVGLAAVDATAVRGGGVRYASSASAGSPATWLALSDVVATLEPGAKLRVSLTVTPPSNAAPGTVIAGLVARVNGAVRATDQSSVKANASVTTPVTIRLQGAPTALVSITGARGIQVDGRGFLEITFQNAGATANSMTGHVVARGPTARTVVVRAAVAPLTQTTVRVPFAIPAGGQAVPVSIVTTDGAGDQATWSGSVGLAVKPAASASRSSSTGTSSTLHRLTARLAAHGATLPRLAVILVALVLAAALIWLGAELRRNRAARRSVRRAALDAAAPPAAVSTAGAGAGADARPATVAGAPLGVVADDSMGAVAAQLGALVSAIDRLAIRLADGSALSRIPAPAPAQPMSSASAGGASVADIDALLYAPSAARVPEASPDDLYDWPTEAQLEQFAARRRAAPPDRP